MHPSTRLRNRVWHILFLALLSLPLTVSASDDTKTLPFSDLTVTEPDKHYSDTSECVAPEDEMRRNHMEMLLHQRDDTMYEGIRTRQFSLEECVNCHVAKDTAGDYIPINDPQQFCSSCHTYASVNIDCFQCHATVPKSRSKLHPLNSKNAPKHHHKQANQNLSDKEIKLLASEGKPQ